jgi:hypothetical protein
MVEAFTCVNTPDFNNRLLTVIDIFSIEIFRSRYTVILISFSRPTFPFLLPFPTKKYRNVNG